MAELSLHGHEAALAELADSSLMTDDRLEGHISHLESIRLEAVQRNIGRQAEVAARLLNHFRFELAMRAGVSTEEFASLEFQGDGELLAVA